MAIVGKEISRLEKYSRDDYSRCRNSTTRLNPEISAQDQISSSNRIQRYLVHEVFIRRRTGRGHVLENRTNLLEIGSLRRRCVSVRIGVGFREGEGMGDWNSIGGSNVCVRLECVHAIRPMLDPCFIPSAFPQSRIKRCSASFLIFLFSFHTNSFVGGRNIDFSDRSHRFYHSDNLYKV